MTLQFNGITLLHSCELQRLFTWTLSMCTSKINKTSTCINFYPNLWTLPFLLHTIVSIDNIYKSTTYVWELFFHKVNAPFLNSSIYCKTLSVSYSRLQYHATSKHLAILTGPPRLTSTYLFFIRTLVPVKTTTDRYNPPAYTHSVHGKASPQSDPPTCFHTVLTSTWKSKNC